ncbi:MAG: mechanosensitive ion channel family protein [Candidatus Melainabacteria bacterium]|nr:mechanosensitive ion channel family protein [Candidatus Melainabacteria bacterium]
MKNFLLALVLGLTIIFSVPALAQPALKEKDSSLEANSPDAVEFKTKKHDPKADLHHEIEKIDAESSSTKDVDADTGTVPTGSGAGTGTGSGQNLNTTTNTNTTTTTSTHETTVGDDENNPDNSDPNSPGGPQSESKNDNKSDAKNKPDKNADRDNDGQSKGWESGLIKKQPSRKRQVTVEEIDDGGFSLSGEGKIVLVLVLTLVALACINMFSKRLVSLFMAGDENSEIRKRANTLSHMVVYFLVALTVGLAIVLVLKELGIDIGPILAGAGVVGVALGFGAQSIVRDFISGFYIFWEDQIRVGDVIQIADKSGYVEAMTLRLVTLRDENGNVHYIPCGEIKMVTNMTKNFSRYVLKISLPYAADVDRVLEMVKDIDEELRADPEFGEDILEPIEIMGIDQFENNAIILKARTKTKPIKQWRVGREFNRRLKRRLDKAGIEMPYSNISLVLGDKKDSRENKGEEKK